MKTIIFLKIERDQRDKLIVTQHDIETYQQQAKDLLHGEIDTKIKQHQSTIEQLVTELNAAFDKDDFLTASVKRSAIIKQLTDIKRLLKLHKLDLTRATTYQAKVAQKIAPFIRLHQAKVNLHKLYRIYWAARFGKFSFSRDEESYRRTVYDYWSDGMLALKALRTMIIILEKHPRTSERNFLRFSYDACKQEHADTLNAALSFHLEQYELFMEQARSNPTLFAGTRRALAAQQLETMKHFWKLRLPDHKTLPSLSQPWTTERLNTFIDQFNDAHKAAPEQPTPADHTPLSPEDIITALEAAFSITTKAGASLEEREKKVKRKAQLTIHPDKVAQKIGPDHVLIPIATELFQRLDPVLLGTENLNQFIHDAIKLKADIATALAAKNTVPTDNPDLD